MTHEYVVVVSLVFAVAACGKSEKAPTRPANGAPVAFEVTAKTPGSGRDGKLELRAYNFSDKSIGSYSIAARYTDADGKLVKVGVGTPFEKDVAWTSFSGRSYVCKPKSWCKLEIEVIDVPEGAATAEVALTSARAVAADGAQIESEPLWESDKGMSAWPL